MCSSTRRVALHDGLRARVPVERAVGRREDAVEPRERTQLRDLGEIDEPARNSELVLERDARLEARHVLLPVEQEEVAHLVEVDLGAGSLAEARERLDAAQADRDVERVGELRADPTRGPARRAARELAALDEADVDSRLGEVERGARPDHATSDDHDLGGRGRRGHFRTRFFRKNPRFAGRSARRRMRYGYQSGPKGDATRTL